MDSRFQIKSHPTYGFYIRLVSDQSRYLHNDGVVRVGTRGDGLQCSGFFSSERACKAMIAKCDQRELVAS